MAITVKHSASPSSYANAGFAAGMGRTRTEMLKKYLDMLERKNAQKRQQTFTRNENALDRKANIQRQKMSQDFRAGQSALKRDFRSEESALGRDFDKEMSVFEHEQQKDLLQDRQRFQWDKSNEAHNKDLDLIWAKDLYSQSQLDRQTEAKKDLFDYRLTAQQKREQENYRNKIQEIETSDEYTDDEKRELIRRFQAKQMSIRPVPVPKEPPKYPEGQGVGQVFKQDGYVVQRMPDGSVNKIGEVKGEQPTHQDRIKAWDIASRFATGEDGRVDIDKAKEIQEQILGGGGHQPQEAAQPKLDEQNPYSPASVQQYMDRLKVPAEYQQKVKAIAEGMEKADKSGNASERLKYYRALREELEKIMGGDYVSDND